MVIFNGNLRLGKLGGGKQMYRRTDGQKDIWKFTPVSYRTSALWGRCLSMLFNGKFAFCQFSMLFNGNLRLEKLRGGRTDVRTYGRLEIHPCVLQDIGPLGPLPKKETEK